MSSTSLQSQAGAIVVTGAASGMGGAIARELAAHGRLLVLSDLYAAPLEALAEELRAITPVCVVAGDITSPALHRRLFASLGEQELAVFVHAAGVSPTMAMGRACSRPERAAAIIMEKMLAATPARRFGEAREIAAATAFLVSAAASSITGTDILVDGGTVAGIASAGGVRRVLA